MDRVDMQTTLVDVAESANWRVERITIQAIGHGFSAVPPNEPPTTFFTVYQRGAGPQGSASEWTERLSTTSLSELATLLSEAHAKATAAAPTPSDEAIIPFPVGGPEQEGED